MIRERVDVLVLGGGAGGLAAATAAAAQGACVALIDREDNPGGVLDQCIHHGFGLHRYGAELTGPEFARRLMIEFEHSGAQFFGCRYALALRPDERTLVTLGPEGRIVFQPKAVVLATGARERPFGALLLPGFRPSGILTAGVAQRMVNVDGLLPGRRAIVLGSGDIGLIMARRLHLEGVEVVAVLEQRPYPGGLLRNVVQCLEDFDIPLLLKHTVIEVHGRSRLEGATIAEVDDEGTPIAGSGEFVRADTLILSVGLIPDNELVDGFVPTDVANGGLRVDSQMRTEAEWLFAAGNNTVIFDLADWVAQVGELAGRHAVASALGSDQPQRRVLLRRGARLLHLIPSALVRDGSNSARIFARVDRPIGKAALRIGDLVSRSFVGMRPSEMVDVSLTADEIAELCQLNEIAVEVVTE